MPAVKADAQKCPAGGRTVLKRYNGNDDPVKTLLKIIKIFCDASKEEHRRV